MKRYFVCTHITEPADVRQRWKEPGHVDPDGGRFDDYSLCCAKAGEAHTIDELQLVCEADYVALGGEA